MCITYKNQFLTLAIMLSLTLNGCTTIKIHLLPSTYELIGNNYYKFAVDDKQELVKTFFDDQNIYFLIRDREINQDLLKTCPYQHYLTTIYPKIPYQNNLPIWSKSCSTQQFNDPTLIKGVAELKTAAVIREITGYLGCNSFQTPDNLWQNNEMNILYVGGRRPYRLCMKKSLIPSSSLPSNYYELPVNDITPYKLETHIGPRIVLLPVVFAYDVIVMPFRIGYFVVLFLNADLSHR